MATYKKTINYKGFDIVVTCKVTDPSRGDLFIPAKFKMVTTIALSLFKHETIGIKETELQRIFSVQVDAAKNLIDMHLKETEAKNTIPKALADLGFE
jgi:signal transduction histidine kinase